jgi:hypothetical protein
MTVHCRVSCDDERTLHMLDDTQGPGIKPGDGAPAALALNLSKVSHSGGYLDFFAPAVSPA